MEKLRFGVVGAGGITHGHVRRIAATGDAAVVAVAEPDPHAVARFREATGAEVSVYGSEAEMLAGERLDCVLIASPHTLHFEQSRAALEAGLHVLCEKPMVCSARDAKALIEVIARTGRCFMISYQRHLDRTYLWMKDQLASGALGRVSYISALSCQEWLQVTKGSWRQDPALSGGGQINDTGSHFIDVLIWLGGPVEQVHAYQDFRGASVDINSAVSFRFRSGALGSFTVIGDTQCWWEDWTISGERATIFLRNGRMFRAVMGRPMEEIAEADMPPSPGHIDQAFIDAVRGRSAPPVPAEIGLGVIQLTEAAWRSAREGRAVTVSEL